MIRPTTCPICNHVAQPVASNIYFPFCSERCKVVDFSRWWDGKYQIVDTLEDDKLLEIQEQQQPGGDEGYEE